MPPSRQTYGETAKQVRNLLRSYSAASVAQRALELINSVRDTDALTQLQTFPWITLLLVKLALEDQMIPLDRGAQCPQQVFDRCRKALWDAQSGPDRVDTSQANSSGSIYLMMRSMLQAQLPFQKKVSWDFIRWPALISRLPINHPTRQQFVNRMGMDPDIFICICYAAYLPVLNNQAIIRREDFAPLRQHFGRAVDRFLDEFSLDLSGLRAALRRQLSARIEAGKPPRLRQELFEFPWLSNYPLLRLADGRLVVWHMTVYARGMESAVHKRLSELRGDYSQHFSKVFEDYVLELIADAGLAYLSEDTYKEALASNENAVEAIITSPDANVFVESKMSVYSDDVVLSNRAPVVWKNLKRVREAMHQGWMVGSRLRSGDTPDWKCKYPQEDFLIIVTSQQMSCATGEHFRRMFKHDIFDPTRLAAINAKTPTADQLARLPLKNIIIVSIEEFEHLMTCVHMGEIDLVTFLREIAASEEDPRTSVMFVDQLLGQKTRRWHLTKAMDQARLRAEATLLTLLPN